MPYNARNSLPFAMPRLINRPIISPPDGGWTPVEPDDVSTSDGHRLWFRADLGVTEVAGRISTVADQAQAATWSARQGNDATTYPVISATQKNGLDVMEIDNGAYMQVGEPVEAAMDDQLTFGLFSCAVRIDQSLQKPLTPSNTSTQPVLGIGRNYHSGWSYFGGGRYGLRAGNRYERAASTTGVTVGDWHVFTLYRREADVWEFITNGVEDTVADTTPAKFIDSVDGAAKTRIGRSHPGYTYALGYYDRWLEGDIAEVSFHDGAISVDDARGVHQAMRDRWDI